MPLVMTQGKLTRLVYAYTHNHTYTTHALTNGLILCSISCYVDIAIGFAIDF